MAAWYLDPGLGSGTNAGTTWANAFNSTTTAWTDAITASAAGDDFYVNAASTVSNGSAQTLTFKGTAAAPNRIFSCSTITNEPPVAGDLGAGAAHTTTGAFGVTFQGFFYAYGVVVNCGTGASAASITVANVTSEQTFDTCQLKLLTTAGTSSIAISGTGSRCTFINTTATFNGGVASRIALTGTSFVWKNTASAVLGSTAITNLIVISSPSLVLLDGVDLTGVASTKNITQAFTIGGAVQIVNCKITSGALYGTPTVIGAITDVIVSDSGATGYIQSRYTYQGTLTANTSVYNAATDGVTPISWQVVTTANAKRQSPFECFQIVQWAAAATYAASLIQITSATASLLNSDVWVDVEYLASGSTPLASTVSSGTATQLTTGSGLAAGTWATGGLGNDYKLVIPSFTTALAGYVRFTVKVARASITVCIDPAVTIA